MTLCISEHILELLNLIAPLEQCQNIFLSLGLYDSSRKSSIYKAKGFASLTEISL